MTSTNRSSISCMSLFVGVVLGVHGCGSSSKTDAGAGGSSGHGGIPTAGTAGAGGASGGGGTTARAGSGGTVAAGSGGTATGDAATVGGSRTDGPMTGGGAGGTSTGGAGGQGTQPSGTGGASAGGAGGQGTQPGGTGGVVVASSDAGAAIDQVQAQAVDAPSAARAEQVCRDAILAQCERLAACTSYKYSVCAATADRCPDYYFGLGSLRTVESVEACIPTLKQATCTDYDMGLRPACLVNGLGAATDPCGASSQCASGVCYSGGYACGTCQAAGAIGAGCDLYTPCAAGGICSPGTRACVDYPLIHAAEGQPCAYGGNPLIGCEGDLVCVPTTRYGSTGTCKSMPKQGEECLDSAGGGFYGLPACAPGFACGIDRSDGLRTARCGNPAPCGKTVCDANSYCYETPTVFNVCKPYSSPGHACTVSYGEHNCASGSVCVPAADGGDQGTCVAIVQVGVGEACNATATCKGGAYCQSGRCTSYDPASCLQSPDGGP